MKTSVQQGKVIWKAESKGSCGSGACSACSTGCARTEGKKLWVLGTLAVAAISVVTGMLYTSRGEPAMGLANAGGQAGVQNVAFQIPNAWQIHPEQMRIIANSPSMNPVAMQPPPVMFAPWPGQDPGWSNQNQMNAMTPVAMGMPGQGMMPMPTQAMMPMQAQGTMPMVMAMTAEGGVMPMVIMATPNLRAQDGMQQ